MKSISKILILGLACMAAMPYARADELAFHAVPLGPQRIGAEVLFAYHAEGGTQPYRFSVSEGMLPAGLLLSPSGLLSGTLASPGVSTYRLTVADSAGASVSAQTTFSVTTAPLFERAGHTLFGGRTGLLVADGAMIVAQLLDYRTTIKCVRLPGGVCTESNPALLAAGINPATARGAKEFLLLKTVGPAAVVASQQIITRKLHFSGGRLDAAIAGTWFSAVGQGIVDYHNHRLTQQLQAAALSGT